MQCIAMGDMDYMVKQSAGVKRDTPGSALADTAGAKQNALIAG